jgi:hypothetical protein
VYYNKSGLTYNNTPPVSTLPGVKKIVIGKIKMPHPLSADLWVEVAVTPPDDLASARVHVYGPAGNGLPAVISPSLAIELAGLLAVAWKFIDNGCAMF